MKPDAMNASTWFSLRTYRLITLVWLLASALVFRIPESSAQTQLPYRDPKRSIEERVRDLLSRMTLEEKVAQTMCLWMEKPNDNTGVPKELLPLGGSFSPALAKEKMPYGI